MKARVVNKSIISVFIAMILLTALFPADVYASSSVVTLTFGDDEIEETVTGNGYKIDGTTLNITESGVYIITGSCAEGSISVNKNLDGVILIMENLSLSSSVTAPLVVKKNSNVTVHTNGSVELYDLEDASTEETNSDFAGAAGVDGALTSSDFNQYYAQITSGTLNEGLIICIKQNNKLLYNETMVRKVSYYMYSSPDMVSNTITAITGSSADGCKSNAWEQPREKV